MDKDVDVFDRDAATHSGYLYTRPDQLSCRLATRRSAEAVLATGCLHGRSIVDMGCGDGFFSVRFWDRAGPKAFVGVDPASHAIAIANANRGGRPIRFAVCRQQPRPRVHAGSPAPRRRSAGHHPRSVSRRAGHPVHEPNGNNLGLKIIEKTSRYHREHYEQSSTIGLIRRWIDESGGRVSSVRFAGFVPMFCPPWLARAMKGVEPLVARMPFLDELGCFVVVIAASRPKRDRENPVRPAKLEAVKARGAAA